MRPATSILLLTTLTGFAYGLLSWLGLYVAIGAPRSARTLVLCGVGTVLVLATFGLIASAMHLGRKERAWRAFSQWRSSWLSREGVAAVLTYPIALGFAWAEYHSPGTFAARALGIVATLAGLGTVYCTAMIYASLKPIRQWHNPHTAPDYLIYALFSGATVFALLHTLAFGTAAGAATLASCAAAVALIAKLAYWRHVDAQSPRAALASAIGLARNTEVRSLETPHFTENFILREMGFQIARRHAATLRRIALVLAFVLPFVFSLLSRFDAFPITSASLAVVFAAIGLLTERWLFFAQATHVAALYYGQTV